MKEINYEKVTQLMKQTRKENKITQEQIANDLNCTVSFISNIENNHSKLNLRVLSYYSRICNTPIEVFLEAGLSKEMKSNSFSPTTKSEADILDDALLNIFHTYTLKERKKIIGLLTAWKSDDQI